jgi:hypothetical protein
MQTYSRVTWFQSRLVSAEDDNSGIKIVEIES